ncbi:hypothetical protein [Serratia fonticola]|uniref:Uncharacterized protein n=1 Tax=Serratia fonticola TaxID=47917 RepID=A0ABY9PUI3_SERFO|nr:hypothetical protein [Serratia fonticola]WMT16667.1 hypothetical protein RFB13_10230 [Serratia fonticola]
MKKTVYLSLLIVFALLGFSSGVMADTYQQEIKNCSITKLDTNKWQAKFTLVVKSYAGGGTSIRNVFYAEVPVYNSYGLILPKASALTSWSNVTVNANMRFTAGDNELLFYGSSNTSMITGGSDISVDFTTTAQNAYPGLRTYHTMDYGMGGASASIFYVTAKGCMTSSTMAPTPEEVDPPEPQFSMKSAVWELNTADVSDLPILSASGNGFSATIKDIANNNLCLKYVTAGVKKTTYALSVTNTSNVHGGRNLFTLQGANSQLFYDLQLVSNTGVKANDYSFPAASVKYITLSQTASSESGRSEMCWTPKINLFKDASTKEGMHSGTMNFVISPKA